MLQFPLNNNYFDVDKDINIAVETVRQCMYSLIDCKILMPRSHVKKLDTIDVTRFAEGNDDGDSACLPMIGRTKGEHDMLQQYWTITIPPLIDGVIRANKGRYLVYQVTDINLEEKSYKVAIVDYGADMNVWQVNSIVDATVHVDDDVYFETQGMDLHDFLNSMFVNHPKDFVPPSIDKQTLKNLKEITLPLLRVSKEKDQFKDMMDHFLSFVIKVNYELMNGERPKAVRGNRKVNVKTITDKVPDKAPKPQIVRTMKSGVIIKSVHVPKAPTIDVVRHYKVASWSVRGHVRHLKSGKTIYIAPGVHHRKEFEKTDAPKRQTIIVSGRGKGNVS